MNRWQTYARKKFPFVTVVFSQLRFISTFVSSTTSFCGRELHVANIPLTYYCNNTSQADLLKIYYNTSDACMDNLMTNERKLFGE